MLVETHALTKQYGSMKALRDCTLGVAEGEVFGLLGPNGAGKTTLLRLLLGYLRPTSGQATVAGLDCQRDSVEVRRKVAYLPGDVRLFDGMRGRDCLAFLTQVRPDANLDRAMGLAKRLELDLKRRVAFMSTGMRQKLALAATMAADVPLLILDEPTANLDPTVRGDIVRMVDEARTAGRTVIFSSHVLSEVEEVCDRVVILRKGELVHTQPMADLRRQHRIRARLTGTLPPVPDPFREDIRLMQNEDEVVIESPVELGPLLGWLATLPMDEVTIEPVGLRAVYDRYHSEAA